MRRKINSAAKVIALLFVLVLTSGLFCGRADAASGKKTLIVYFSRTGTTKKAAEQKAAYQALLLLRDRGYVFKKY